MRVGGTRQPFSSRGRVRGRCGSPPRSPWAQSSSERSRSDWRLCGRSSIGAPTPPSTSRSCETSSGPVTYPYFPGVFFPQAGLVELGGLDLPTVLNLLVPVIGALAVLPMFLLAVRIARDDRIGLFAAAFLAGAIPHAYTTAHSAPATLGDVLALTGLILFLRLRTDRRAMAPLLLVSGALIPTHHLSLYFFILMVLGALVIRGFARPWRADAESSRQVTFAVVLIGRTFAYWFGYATAFREWILPDVDIRPWWLLFVGFAAGVAALAGLIAARTR